MCRLSQSQKRSAKKTRSDCLSKQPETLFKERLFRKLKKKRLKNVYIKKLVAGSVGGIPDLLIIVRGLCVMPELKMEGNRPTPLQLHNIKQINAAGGFSFPLYPVEENAFVEWVAELALGVSLDNP